MKKLCFSLLAFFLTLCANQVSNADPLLQYNNIELGYRYTDPDPGDKLNGGYGRASYSLFKYTFLDIGYGFDSSSTLDLQTFQYGGGLYFPLHDKIHFLVNVGGRMVRADYEEFGSTTTDRVFVGPAFRAKFHPNVEFDAGFDWETGEGKDRNRYNIGLLFKLLDATALRTAVDFLDQHGQQFSAGVLFTF